MGGFTSSGEANGESNCGLSNNLELLLSFDEEQ
jgi:hypothetical protein